MKKVTIFETSDGKLFKNKNDAETHEEFLRMREMYNNVELRSEYGDPVSFFALHQWLHDNSSYVQELLKIEPEE